MGNLGDNRQPGRCRAIQGTGKHAKFLPSDRAQLIGTLRSCARQMDFRAHSNLPIRFGTAETAKGGFGSQRPFPLTVE
jgi:hypothetical protein